VGNISSATTSARSANSSTLPCAAMATKSKPVTGWRSRQAQNRQCLFDVIVTDIKMPAVDGVEVLRTRTRSHRFGRSF